MSRELLQKFNELRNELSGVGCICMGSINKVYTRCGNSYCPCRSDDQKKHGPYYLWTRKINGKTVSRRIDTSQVKQLKEFFKNYRTMKKLIGSMMAVAEKIVIVKP
jgi:hypothetical protein